MAKGLNMGILKEQPQIVIRVGINLIKRFTSVAIVLGLVQMPIFSWAKPIRIKAEQNYLTCLIDLEAALNLSQTYFKRRIMLIFVKLLEEYITINYALGLAHETFGVWIKAISKSLQSQNSWLGLVGRMAELSQIETCILIQMPNCSCT